MDTRYQVQVDTTGVCTVIDTAHPGKDPSQWKEEPNNGLAQAITTCTELNHSKGIHLSGDADGLLTAIRGKWTKQTPNAPGLYWWRYENSKLVMIVTVYFLRGEERFYVERPERKLYVEQPDEDVPIDEWTDGVWAGPLEHPPIK